MLKLFIKSLWSVCYLYMLLILFILLLYKLFLFSPLYLNIILMLVLSYGILKDERFSLFRKIIFIMLVLIQIIIYKYLGFVPILILKDLFWFSVVLNISFVWHYLILIWLYDFFKRKDNKYWCYLISRMSLLTSLSIINIILSCCLLLSYNLYFYLTIKNYNKYKIFYNFLDCLLLMLYKVNVYFIRVFNLYSLFLLGLIKNKFKLNMELLKTISIFVIFLLLSILLQTPRLYIIWIFYGIYYLYDLFKNNIKFYFQFKNKILKINFFEEISDDLYKDIIKDPAVNLLSIFRHDILSDFFFFLLAPKWTSSINFGHDFLYFTIFDVIRLFIYDSDWKIKLCISYLIYSTELSFEINKDNNIEIESYIKFYNLNCDINEFINLYENLKLLGEFNIIYTKFSEDLPFKNLILGPIRGRVVILESTNGKVVIL